MNRKYLGDALDHWKGSLFESLQQRDALRDFAVDTMATDMNDWQSEDINVFSRLLRIRTSQIIRHTVTLKTREKYFAEIEHSGDLFFDPDTGIQTGPVKNPAQYIQPGEILHFLKNHERIVGVYQHVRAQAASGRVDAVCRTLSAVSTAFLKETNEPVR
jgi:hypothetical protein